MKYVILLIIIIICAAVPAAGQSLPRSIPEAAGRNPFPVVPSPHEGGPAGALLPASGGGWWQPMGGGVDGKVLGMATLNDELYIIVEKEEERNWPWAYTLYKWDGTAWIVVDEFVMDFPAVNGFLEYRGALYMAGSFSMIDFVSGFRGIARWDDTGWVQVRGGILDAFDDKGMDYFYNLREADGKLYAAGSFSANGKSIGFIFFDGTTWKTMEDGPTVPVFSVGPSFFCTAATIYRGDLYLTGRMKLNGRTEYMVKWNGVTWSAVPGVEEIVLRIEEYRGDLYCYGASSSFGSLGDLARWDGTQWHAVGSGGPSGSGNLTDFQVYEGDLYAATIDRNAVHRWDGASWKTVSTFDNDVYILGVLKGELVTGGWFSFARESPAVTLNSVAILCRGGECGSISGTVFNDADADCVRDDTESGIRRHIIEVTPGPFYTTTDENGAYILPVASGTYTVNLIPRLHWEQNCPVAGSHTVTVAGIANAVEDISFGVRPVANVKDLRVTMAAGPARPGRQLIYCITYENAGTVTMDGTVSLLLDPRLTFDSSAPPPTRVQGSLIQWDFTGLNPSQERTIKVYTSVPRTIERGTMICSDVRIDPTFNDYGIDDRDSVCVTVTGSYDPNDISVVPFGLEENGEITPDDSVLTYTVRFQNTGNDTAFQVRVVDILDSNLNIASIRLGTASHPYTFSMGESDVAIWTFEDIMLPDSGASEANSHGMFKYSVHLKPGLMAGTRIPNRAMIYFDHNPPVTTNTVENIITGVLAAPERRELTEAIAFHPNPARTSITITAEMKTGSMVELRDMLGRTMLRRVYDGGTMTIDLTGLPAGRYFVKIPSRTGTLFQQVSVVR